LLTAIVYECISLLLLNPIFSCKFIVEEEEEKRKTKTIKLKKCGKEREEEYINKIKDAETKSIPSVAYKQKLLGEFMSETLQNIFKTSSFFGTFSFR
jgi:hypothetical protein